MKKFGPQLPDHRPTAAAFAPRLPRFGHEEAELADDPFDIPRGLAYTHKLSAFEEEYRRAKRSRRRFIRPENVQAVIDNLPGPNESTSCVLRGDFVLGDLLPAIANQMGKPARLRVSTLSLNEQNAADLVAMLKNKQLRRASLVASTYWQAGKGTAHEILCKLIAAGVAVAVLRCHAKIILFDFGQLKLTIEGSANLRSSANIEQCVITNHRGLHDFHAAWLDDLIKRFPYQTHGRVNQDRPL